MPSSFSLYSRGRHGDLAGPFIFYFDKQPGIGSSRSEKKAPRAIFRAFVSRYAHRAPVFFHRWTIFLDVARKSVYLDKDPDLKPRHLAEMLGVDVTDIYAVRKRLTRKLRNFTV